MRPVHLIAVALAAASALVLLHGRAPPRPQRSGVPARVVRVVDGDTLVASAGGRSFYVRLLGIDTPETHRPGTPVECGGPEAAASMRRLAPPGARVTLAADPAQDRVDRYGRLLAYVWLGDGRLLESEQLASGWATTYVFAGRPVSLYPLLAAAARAARAARRGAWAACGGDFHSAGA